MIKLTFIEISLYKNDDLIGLKLKSYKLQINGIYTTRINTKVYLRLPYGMGSLTMNNNNNRKWNIEKN